MFDRVYCTEEEKQNLKFIYNMKVLQQTFEDFPRVLAIVRGYC
jgi:hypothetical protein